jgi:hypothetical protein
MLSFGYFIIKFIEILIDLTEKKQVKTSSNCTVNLSANDGTKERKKKENS